MVLRFDGFKRQKTGSKQQILIPPHIPELVLPLQAKSQRSRLSVSALPLYLEHRPGYCMVLASLDTNRRKLTTTLNNFQGRPRQFQSMLCCLTMGVITRKKPDHIWEFVRLLNSFWCTPSNFFCDIFSFFYLHQLDLLFIELLAHRRMVFTFYIVLLPI